jgi:hypothetical protein
MARRKINELLASDLIRHVKEAESANKKLRLGIAYDFYHQSEGLRLSIGNSRGAIIDKLYMSWDYRFSEYRGRSSFCDFLEDLDDYLGKKIGLPMGKDALLGWEMRRIDEDFKRVFRI